MPAFRLAFHTLEIGPYDLHVRALRDRDQFGDVDGEAEALGVPPAMWPLFGQVWECGRLLAEQVADLPVRGLRVLEVGCGLGLASLILNKRGADITATDIHPEAGRFLAYNTALNGDPPLRFVRCDWGAPAPELGRFSLIVGSEVLYEAPQVERLASFVDAHAESDAGVIVIDPGRGLLGRFSTALRGRGFHRQERLTLARQEGKAQVLLAERGGFTIRHNEQGDAGPRTPGLDTRG